MVSGATDLRFKLERMDGWLRIVNHGHRIIRPEAARRPAFAP
jgi:hypothetical protein